MRLGELLEHKASLGVKVKILIDDNKPFAAGVAVAAYIAFNGELHDYAYDRDWLARAANGEIEGIELAFASIKNTDNVIDDVALTHHQKSVVIDSSVAFVLGQDFTDGDYDSRDHKKDDEKRNGTGLRQDINVMIEGPAVEYVESNFVDRWNVNTSKQLTVSSYEGEVSPNGSNIQVLRTRNNEDCDIIKAKIKAISKANNYIYIEDQYTRSELITQAIATRLSENENLRVVIASNEDELYFLTTGYTEETFSTLSTYMDGDNPRVSFYQLKASGEDRLFLGREYESINIHSKVMIVDDEFVIQGSANMNTRSNFHDSELSVLIQDKHYARKLRTELWSDHLGVPASSLNNYKHGIDFWKTNATNNLERMDNNEPLKGHACPLEAPLLKEISIFPREYN
jgi:phosphatidylserine/phosphatidylglycerophosphate/cardiolipin synthase-like enzyme